MILEVIKSDEENYLQAQLTEALVTRHGHRFDPCVGHLALNEHGTQQVPSFFIVRN